MEVLIVLGILMAICAVVSVCFFGSALNDFQRFFDRKKH